MQLDQFIKYSEFLYNVPNMHEFDIHGYDISEDRTLPELLKHIYEWEYKYNVVASYNIPDNRKSNMLSKIEDKINPLISAVAEALKETYDKWLSLHAITDPDTWARSWVNDSLGEGDDFILGSMWTTYNQYCYSDENQKLEDFMSAVAGSNEVTECLNNFISEEIDQAQSELDNEDPSSENINELTERIDYLNSILNNANEMCFYLISIFGNVQELVNFLRNSGISAEEICFYMYKDIIFPEWYRKWEYENIDQIHDENIEIVNELNAIDSKSFKQKMATLSIALNGIHVTGSMIDHVNNNFPNFAGDLSAESLSALSNIDEDTIRAWEDELKEGL